MIDHKEEELGPLVTIACLSYNTSQYVLETLKSILCQTYRNIEVFIIDDASRDNSVELIEAFLKEHAYPLNFTLVKSTINKGICFNLNTILRKAKGKYFTVIAADDVMKLDKVANLVRVFEELGPEYGLVYSNVEIIDETGNLISNNYFKYYGVSPHKTDDPYSELLLRNFIPAMSTILPVSLLKRINGYDEDLIAEDYSTWLKVSKVAKVKYLDVVTSQYRIRSNSIMTGGSRGTIILDNMKALVKQLSMNNNVKVKTKIKYKIKALALEYFKLTGRLDNTALELLKSAGLKKNLVIFSLAAKNQIIRGIAYRLFFTYRLIK